MKQTPLKRKTWIRKTPIGKVSTRLAARQAREMKALHREAVMLRWNMNEFPNPPRFDDEPRAPSWRGKCLHCQKDGWVQCSHVYPIGKYPNSKFDPDNAIPLCFRCHIHWWHKNPIEARAWIVELLGAEAVERLELRVKTASRPDLEATRIYLEQEVKKLRQGRTGSD